MRNIGGTLNPRKPVGNVYVRIIYFRENERDAYLLMQERDQRILIFPGGRFEREDGDVIDTLERELTEETHLPPCMWLDWDLLFESKWFQLLWEGNKDVYFVVRWVAGDDQLPIYNLRQGDEDATVTRRLVWVNLYKILSDETLSKRMFDNIRRACTRTAVIIATWDSHQ